jgi:hypothetical protein
MNPEVLFICGILRLLTQPNTLGVF